MTKEETKHMDAKFKEMKEQISNLAKIITPVVTKVAILEERQKEHPTVNKMYAVIGGLVTLVVAMMAIVVTLIVTVSK